MPQRMHKQRADIEGSGVDYYETLCFITTLTCQILPGGMEYSAVTHLLACPHKTITITLGGNKNWNP